MRCRGSSKRQTIAVFKRFKVLSKRELEARYEVFVEQYSVKLNIEAEPPHRSRAPSCCRPRCVTCPAARGRRRRPDEETAELVSRFVDGSSRSSASTPRIRTSTGSARALHARRGRPGDGRRRASPTGSSGSSPTTSGRCRSTRRCCSSVAAGPSARGGPGLSSRRPGQLTRRRHERDFAARREALDSRLLAARGARVGHGEARDQFHGQPRARVTASVAGHVEARRRSRSTVQPV